MPDNVRRRSYFLRKSVLTSIAILFAAPVFAAVNVQTTYDISALSTSAKTIYKNAPTEMDSRFDDQLWEIFQSRLKTLPNVIGVQTGEMKTLKVTTDNTVGYNLIKKNFVAFVQLSLPKPVTMLMKIEATRRICKDPSELKSDTAPDCSLNSTVEIKGPMSVYGTFETESNLNLSDLLRDKQTLLVKAYRSDDKADLELDSVLFVDSMMFEKSLLQFFDIFNVSGISKKTEDLTRQSIFLGVARVMRQSNERMLDL